MHRPARFVLLGLLVVAATMVNEQPDVFGVQFTAVKDAAREEWVLARNTVCNPRVEVCK